MVFPQGRFSGESMKLLKQNNFLAAANTEPLPANAANGEGLKISDFLDPAITGYGTFPLFVRRYPEAIINLVFDMFFGKPLFITAHHDDFRNGNAKIINCVEKLNSLKVDIAWEGLKTAIRKSYLERTGADGKIYVKIFANEVALTNNFDTPKEYVITKHEDGAIPMQITLDGEKTSYAVKDGALKLHLAISPQETRSLQIIYEKDLYCQNMGNSLKTNMKVHLRRRLSEFRDQYLSRSDFLMDLAKSVLNRFSR
jgi:hypothetical protein